jgi:hypothetical protein
MITGMPLETKVTAQAPDGSLEELFVAAGSASAHSAVAMAVQVMPALIP